MEFCRADYTTSPTSNRLVGLDSPTRTIEYDSGGNSTSDSQRLTGWAATYDLIGRLISNLSNPPEMLAVYTYNNFGQRIGKAVTLNCVRGSRTCPNNQPPRIVYVYGFQGHLMHPITHNSACPRIAA